jgi:Arc/MetJ-type ribon-helix-helix transcriptional regulator
MEADKRIHIRVTDAYVADVRLIEDEYKLNQSQAVRKAIHDMAARIRTRKRKAEKGDTE